MQLPYVLLVSGIQRSKWRPGGIPVPPSLLATGNDPEILFVSLRGGHNEET